MSGIDVIEMPIWPTLGIMSIEHNINGVGLLTPLVVGTIETMVTKVTMAIGWLDELCTGGVSVVVVL